MTGISEIDIDAILSYNAIHSTYNKSYPDYSIEQMKQYLIDRNIGYNFKKKKSRIPRLKKDKIQKLFQACINTNNYGDISLIKPNKLPNFDLFNFTFSCQSVSVAGKQAGMKDKDGNITRTGQYIYGIDIIRTKKPKYILIENVKGLISKKFINDFYDIINNIEQIGYDCYYPKNDKEKPKCLNAKDYGIPQNRERIYVICIRRDVDDHTFKFPDGFDNGTRLKDILENEVEEKYYISQDKTNKLLEQLTTNDIGINPCLTPDRINKRQNGRRFKNDGEPSFTINTQDRNGILINKGYAKIKNDNICSCLDANYYKGLDNHAARTGILETGVYNQKDGFKQRDIGCTLDASYYKGLGNNQNRNAVLESNNINVIGKLEIKGQDNIRRVYNPNGISPALTTMEGGSRQPKIIENNDLTFIGGIGNKDRIGNNKKCSRNYPQGNRVYGTKGIAVSQTAQGGGIGSYTGLYKINNNCRIRKLTPLECWRLMSFDDEDFYKVKNMGISDTQLYKMAGNSIVVKVLEYIFKNLFDI